MCVGDHQQTGDDAAFVAEFDREPARRDRHQEVAEIMRELHPGRLRKIEMQLLLKMFVHHVDHPVAKSPKRKQEDEEEEGESDFASVFEHEHPAPSGVRIHPRVRGGGARFCRNCRCSHSLIVRT